MGVTVSTASQESVADLIHDLRQPLSTIEYSACYLQMLLAEAGAAVQEQLRLIQRQLDHAAMLLDAASTASRPDDQRTAAGESFDLTKSETAVVT
jgi:signal transduction histidine kinase